MLNLIAIGLIGNVIGIVCNVVLLSMRKEDNIPLKTETSVADEESKNNFSLRKRM